jgi:hypothetical protein
MRVRGANGKFEPSRLLTNAAGERLKECSYCHLWKSLDHFFPKEYDDRRQVRLWSSRCKLCHKVVQRRKAGYNARKPAMTPEQQHARRLELYEARMAVIRADPELLAAHREDMRVKEKLRRERNGSKTYPPRRKQNGKPIDRAYAPVSSKDALDAAPFIQWLRREFPGTPIPDIARQIALPERHLRDLFGGVTDRVTLDFVDRAVTRGLGRPDALNTIYPMP